MKSPMPPSAEKTPPCKRKEMGESKKHNTETHMENSMKGMKKSDLSRGYSQGEMNPVDPITFGIGFFR